MSSWWGAPPIVPGMEPPSTGSIPATDHSAIWDFLSGTGHTLEAVGTEAVSAVKGTGRAIGDFGGGLLGGILRPLIVPLLLLILLVVALTVLVGRVERVGVGG